MLILLDRTVTRTSEVPAPILMDVELELLARQYENKGADFRAAVPFVRFVEIVISQHDDRHRHRLNRQWLAPMNRRLFPIAIPAVTGERYDYQH